MLPMDASFEKRPFEEIFIQPSAGDGGGALGAALWAYNTLLGNPRQFVLEHAFWGKSYSDSEVKAFLEEQGIRYERLDEDRLLDRTVEALQGGEVIGWYQDGSSGGRAPWGIDRSLRILVGQT